MKLLQSSGGENKRTAMEVAWRNLTGEIKKIRQQKSSPNHLIGQDFSHAPSQGARRGGAELGRRQRVELGGWPI